MTYVREFNIMVTDSNQMRTYKDPETRGLVALENRDGGVWLSIENIIGKATLTTRARLDERDMANIGAWLKVNLDRMRDEASKEET